MPSQAKKTRSDGVALRRVFFHPRRLEIFSLLSRRKGGTEAYLADELELSAAQVTYHLKVLEGADLVSDAESPEAEPADRYFVATPTW